MISRVLFALLLGSVGGCVLDIEVLSPDPDPSDPGPVTPTAPVGLLAEWSGCMSLESFKSANMAQAWGSIAVQGGGTCTSCHNAVADYGYPFSSVPEPFFKAISEHAFNMLAYFMVDTTIDPAKVVIVRPTPFHGVATGLDPHRQHPRFSVEGAPMTALTTFYNATMARKVAGTCDPPRLVD